MVKTTNELMISYSTLLNHSIIIASFFCIMLSETIREHYYSYYK